MSGRDFLNWYLGILPLAIVADALLLTGGVALMRKWRHARANRS